MFFLLCVFLKSVQERNDSLVFYLSAAMPARCSRGEVGSDQQLPCNEYVSKKQKDEGKELLMSNFKLYYS